MTGRSQRSIETCPCLVKRSTSEFHGWCCPLCCINLPGAPSAQFEKWYFKNQQVMYAQDHDSNSANMSTYGSLGANTQLQLPNGVSSGSQQSTGGASRALHGDNPHVFDPAPATTARQPTGAQTTGAQELQGPDHPPYGQGLQQELAQAAQQPRPLSLVHGRSVATPQTLRSAVRVQKLFSAESRTSSVGQEQQGVRWMARFTEFLRTTASRGATRMDRMLEPFGIQHGGHGAPLRVQQGSGVQHQINFSPPGKLSAPPHPFFRGLTQDPRSAV